MGDQNDFAQKVNAPTPPPVPLKKSTSSDTSVVLKNLAVELCRLREDLSRPVPIVERGNQTYQDDFPQPYRRDSSYHEAGHCVQQNFEKTFVAAPPVDLTRDGCDVTASPLPNRPNTSYYDAPGCMPQNFGKSFAVVVVRKDVSNKILKKVLLLQHKLI